MNEPIPALVSFKVSGETLDLDYLLNAPYEDIAEAAEKIPAAIGWLGYHKALGVERLIISEQQWKKAEANAYFELKNGQFVSEGFGDKPTEEALKRAIMMMPTVDDACADYAKRKRHVEWISGTVDALQAKLDLVRSSEATRRMEHEPDRNKRTVI